MESAVNEHSVHRKIFWAKERIWVVFGLVLVFGIAIYALVMSISVTNENNKLRTKIVTLENSVTEMTSINERNNVLFSKVNDVFNAQKAVNDSSGELLKVFKGDQAKRDKTQDDSIYALNDSLQSLNKMMQATVDYLKSIH